MKSIRCPKSRRTAMRHAARLTARAIRWVTAAQRVPGPDLTELKRCCKGTATCC